MSELKLIFRFREIMTGPELICFVGSERSPSGLLDSELSIPGVMASSSP